LDSSVSDKLTWRERASPSEEPDGELLAPAPAVPAGLAQGVTLPHQVALLAVWPFLEQVLGFLVGFVDTAIAGRISVEATNAVGAASYVLWLMGMMIGAVSIGATALIARAAGAGRWRRGNEILGQALAIALVWGLSLGLFFYAVAPWIAAASGLKGESLELSVLYLRILALAAPCTTVLFIGGACLRGAGDTRTPFTVMVVVNAVNVGLCLALAWPSSPWGGWGLMGIAGASATAWVVGSLCILFELLRGRSRVRLHLRYLRPRLAWIVRLVRVGLPSFFENGAQWLGNFVVIAMVGRLPFAGAIGAHIVTVRIEAMSYMPGFAMGLAAATLTGQYLGAGDPRTARRAVWWCWAYGAGLMTVLGLLFFLIPDVFVRIVTDKPEFLAASPPLLRIVGPAQTGFACCLVFSMALRGAGDTRTAMLLTFGSTFLVRVPLVWLLAMHLGYGLVGVWIALSFELVFRGLLFLGAFVHGHWARVRV
jgi:putative MATE family efflux protein